MSSTQALTGWLGTSWWVSKDIIHTTDLSDRSLTPRKLSELVGCADRRPGGGPCDVCLNAAKREP